MCIRDSPKLCDSTPGASCDAAKCDAKTTGSFRPGDSPLAIFQSETYSMSCRYGVAVSIAEGYVPGDQLIFISYNSPEFSATFDADHGLLMVRGSGNASVFQRAMHSVRFASSSTQDHARTISWTLLESSQQTTGPVHLVSSGLFVEFVPSPQISYTAAAAQCGARILGNATGRLASFQSAKDVTSIISAVGGATNGWIAGSGKVVAGSVVWSWDGQTAGSSVLYRGDALTGSSVTFTNFLSGEPAMMDTGVVNNMAMTAAGKWITRNTKDSTDIGGYYCTFDKAAATTVDTGMIVLEPYGCLPKLCAYDDQSACELDVRCSFDASTGTCGVSKCNGLDDIVSCALVHGCFFDATTGSCTEMVPAPTDECTNLSPADCMQNSACLVRNGTCTVGCGMYPLSLIHI
eukprot:TRINITY_DN1091_c0_g1_i1.p1 TRINITY_DN1091_c0_g1~~TRINITY_DN1091_c0_g1_i1.p1  ORF type:complete len:405 (-),score=168.64 TRINITY_DN1091_c0_g1_i1:107-1321(-)